MGMDAHKATITYLQKNMGKNKQLLLNGDQLVKSLTQQLTQNTSTTNKAHMTIKLDGQSESRITHMMEELAEETRAQRKMLELNQQEIAKMRTEIKKNKEEIERIHRLIDTFDRKFDVGLGELKVVWGY